MPRLPRAGWLVGSAVLAVVVVVGGWVLWPRDAADPYPTRPEAVYTAAQAHSFGDLATMTASSSLVVRGTVTDVGQGGEVEIPDGSDAVHTSRKVFIAVDEVLYRRYDGDVSRIVVMTEGYWRDGVGYARQGVPWLEVGDQGYFYLTAPPPERRDGQDYSIVSQYGRVLLGEDDQRVAVPGHWTEEGPWSSTPLVAGDPSSFQEQIEAAAAAAASGEAEPKLVTACEPSEPGDEDSSPVCWEQ